MGVGPGALSFTLNQPSAVGSMTFPFESVNVGTGRVAIDPVEVYTGSSETEFAGASSVTGGHGYCAVAATIVPAPAPPVIHES